MKSKKLNQIIKVISLIVLLLGGYTVYDTYSENTTIKIANWNLHVFGTAKSSNSDLMNFYAYVIDDYDIIFVQEIRDKSETAFPKLCAMLQNYSCLVSGRAGRTSSKEQYGLIYRDWINITNFKDFNPDKQNRWERPPIKTQFQIKDYSLVIYNIHTKPEDVKKEMNFLEDAINDNGNVMILGDLNADCSYYNNAKEREFDNWKWLISDDEDTTVSATNCAYDRIILNNNAYREFKSYGIYKDKISSDISDHYLVWVEIEVD